MKITICGSIEFADKLIELSDKLEKMGHKTELPHAVLKIKNKEMSLEDFKNRKEQDGGDYKMRQESNVDFIKRYYNLIKESDAILVVNVNKKGIKNYIGGNTFLEIGFAYVLDKKIFLLNPIPEVSYKDEVISCNPIVIKKDLDKIK